MISGGVSAGEGSQLVQYRARCTSSSQVTITISDEEVESRIGMIAGQQMGNIDSAMSNLQHVGNYLQLAYAGSRGFSSNEKIVAIVADYQTLVNDSALACNTFVETCYSSVKIYDLAIKAARKGKLKDSMRLLSTCEKKAQAMIEQSDKLVRSCTKVCEMSKEALVEATKNDVTSRKQKRELEESIARLNAREEELKTKREDLKGVIEEERERERIAAKNANVEQQRAFVLSIVQTALTPLQIGQHLASAVGGFLGGSATTESQDAGKEKGEGKSGMKGVVKSLLQSSNQEKERIIKNEAALQIKKEQLKKMDEKKEADPKEIEKLEAEIAELEITVARQNKESEESKHMMKDLINRSDRQAKNFFEQESLAAERRRQWQKVQMDCNAEFAKTVTELKNMHNESNELGRAIKSLEVTVQTLGKVKTIFENVRMYWELVHQRCIALADMDTVKCLADCEMTEDFIEEIVQKQLDWFCLGAMIWRGGIRVLGAKKKMDSIMNHLPSKEEGEKLIEVSCNSILQQLEGEKIYLEKGEGGEKES